MNPLMQFLDGIWQHGGATVSTIYVVVTALASLVNAYTEGHQEYQGVAQLLVRISEFLGILTGKGSQRGPFKMPLCPERLAPLKKVDDADLSKTIYRPWRRPPTGGLGLLLALSIFSSGCSHTQQVSVEKWAGYAIAGGKTISSISEPVFRQRCMSIAQECLANGDKECAQWSECAKQRAMINNAIKLGHLAAIEAITVADTNKDNAMEKLEVAFLAFKQAYDLLVDFKMISETKDGVINE
jgi:hypothetical protein